MPSESRSIHFSRDEVVAAVKRHLRPDAGELTEGHRPDVRFTAEPTLAVAYVLRDEFNRERFSQDLEPAAVAAALIKFCKDEKIPLARRATKSLQVAGDHLVLVLRIRS